MSKKEIQYYAMIRMGGGRFVLPTQKSEGVFVLGGFVRGFCPRGLCPPKLYYSPGGSKYFLMIILGDCQVVGKEGIHFLPRSRVG